MGVLRSLENKTYSIGRHSPSRTQMAFRKKRRARKLPTRAINILAVAVLIIPSLTVFPMHGSANSGNVWQTTRAMAAGHGNAGETVLQNGEVLAVSGDAGLGNDTATPTSELYNPSTGTWSETGQVNQPRTGYYAPITLNNGLVLMAGGDDPSATTDYASAELYTPSTGQWAYTGSLNTSRRFPVTVKLADGRVLVASGAHGAPDGGRFLFSAEVYDPSTGHFTFTGGLPLARDSGSGILLHDGRVLLFGGEGPWLVHSAQTELYNPSSNSWSLTGSLPYGITGAATVVLQDGRVMVAGGNANGNATTNQVNMYDPSTGTWSTVAPMNDARQGGNAVLLPNGQVLVAGGADANGNPVLTSELYDPVADTWMNDAVVHQYHASGNMLLLNDGTPIILGGYGTSGPSTDTELYTNPSTQPPLSYDVLGDSFSSGDGAQPYSDPTCKVSENSLAIFLRVDHPDLNLAQPNNLACTGATTDQVLSNQIGFLAADNNADPVKVVTMTVGGDDVGFGGILTKCYYAVGKAYGSLFSSQTDKDNMVNAGCMNSQQAQLDKAISGLPAQLATVYEAIHVAAPQAKILVLGYPDIFPVNPTSSCDGLPQASVAWLSQEGAKLDGMIQGSVAAASSLTAGQAHYVDAFNVFQNNTVCSANPWVNPIDGQTFADFFQNGIGGHGLSDFGNVIGNLQNTPFHPNAAGYEAWANTVYANWPTP